MKAPFIPLVAVLLGPLPAGAAQHTVGAAGLTFSPSTINASVGDTVNFTLSQLHNAVQVAESTWNVNGDLPLSGGFAIPFGGGSIVLADTGTMFYVCEAHIASGMKGKIVVGPPPPPTSTITLTSVADRDASPATTGDRVAKPWSLRLYQDSVGSGIVIDSVQSGTSLTVAGLPAGTYVAASADSAPWSHLSLTVDGISQGVTPQNSWSFTVSGAQSRSVEFIHTVPNMVISVGASFDPDTLLVTAGDTVFFVLSPGHAPREVSKATWLSGGTASNGGFDLPDRGGWYVAAAGGIDYYVCVNHAGSGSKGIVMVEPIPPSTITLISTADRDGDHATVADRVPRRWSLRLYQDSVGSGVVLDSVASDDTLVVAGLPPGVYAAAEADSVPWTHVSQIVDGIPQGATSQAARTFSVGSGEVRSVEFINTVANMVISSGFAFSPETLDVDSGETVWFVLEGMHNARQVDSLAWAAGDTVTNGGFDLPFGGGSVVMDEGGEAYYVCVPHAGGGMKGIVRVHVEPSSGVLNDTVADGWNLLSVPFLAADSAVSALYPGAISTAYAYAAGYVARTFVSPGDGYWLKFGGGQAVVVAGLLVETDTIPVAQGWNIVGSLSAPLAVSSIASDPGGLVTSPFFGYDGGYSVADTIVPGRGYWVKASGPGSLILAPSPGSFPATRAIRIERDGGQPPPPPAAAGAASGSPGFGHGRNYPNPFNPSTTIAYSVEREVRVRIEVYNVLGERVAVLVDRTEGPGAREIPFDASSLPGGVYIARVTAGDRTASIRMLLLR